MANINPTREILNNPTESPAGTYTFLPASEEVVATGILSVVIREDLGNNELECEVQFIGDAPKATWATNPKAGIRVNDIFFSASEFIDLGAGFPLGDAHQIPADSTQHDFNAFAATRTIEISN